MRASAAFTAPSDMFRLALRAPGNRQRPHPDSFAVFFGRIATSSRTALAGNSWIVSKLVSNTEISSRHKSLQTNSYINFAVDGGPFLHQPDADMFLLLITVSFDTFQW